MEPGSGVSPRAPVDRVPKWTEPWHQKKTHPVGEMGGDHLGKVHWLRDLLGHFVPKALESIVCAQ